MAKLLFLLIFTFCLALQHAKAFPHNVATSEESTELGMTKDFERGLAKNTTTTAQITTPAAAEQSTDSTQETDTDSIEDFSYLPVLYNTTINRLTLATLKIAQYHLNTLLTVGHDYITAALKTLNELPNKTSNIQANITRLRDLLKRVEGVDLTKKDLDSFLNKTDLMYKLGDLYGDYPKLLRSLEIDDDVLSELYNTLGLRIKASLKENVKKLTKIFHNFFDELDEKDKLRYAELIKLYDDFKSHDMDLDKFGDALFLLTYLLTNSV
ncbi:uncharacterized protein LOC101452381 [Ceratitis capitata]|uniref:Protein G12 n=1 Tax=Ceratitis capitata TaxID=7213 RepID=W8C938_CERCA|nr:uncharacterized protein LOC101452381 [Ceratitis capitata]